MSASAMSEIARIARLLERGFEGKAYFGPSVLTALDGITGELATRKTCPAVHNIWELVAHLTAELNYAHGVIEGTARLWIEGQTTWPAITDISEAAWRQAVEDLIQANRRLVTAISELDDAILDQSATVVGVPFYVMLHGIVQHNVYHAGQISLLKRQLTASAWQS